jgi:hypothetical protein
MIYRCSCGTEYVVIPKEIPLPNDEQYICASCGCGLRGRWSSRNFDYEPLYLHREEHPHNSAVSQNAGRMSSGSKNS